MIMKNYVADELSNKVYHLHKALKQAENIISILDQENRKLKEILLNLGIVIEDNNTINYKEFSLI